MKSEKAEEEKKRVNVGQGDIRPGQPMQICFSHGQSICGHMHVSCTCESERRESGKISRKAPCTVHVTECGRASEKSKRQPDKRLVSPISSQVSNLLFAGSRHQTNPPLYRFMRSPGRPGIYQSRWRGSPFAASGSGVYLCGALSALSALSLSFSHPQLQACPLPRSELHEPEHHKRQ